jgi:hypothetical protein
MAQLTIAGGLFVPPNVMETKRKQATKPSTRKAPMEPASQFEEGTEKEGANGVVYVVKVIKNGSKRWMKKPYVSNKQYNLKDLYAKYNVTNERALNVKQKERIEELTKKLQDVREEIRHKREQQALQMKRAVLPRIQIHRYDGDKDDPTNGFPRPPPCA